MKRLFNILFGKFKRKIYIRGSWTHFKKTKEFFKDLGYKNYNDWNYDDEDLIYYTKGNKVLSSWKSMDNDEYEKIIDTYEEYRFDD